MWQVQFHGTLIVKPHANKKMVILFKCINIVYKFKCIGLTLLNLWNDCFSFGIKAWVFLIVNFGVLDLETLKFKSYGFKNQNHPNLEINKNQNQNWNHPLNFKIKIKIISHFFKQKIEQIKISSQKILGIQSYS